MRCPSLQRLIECIALSCRAEDGVLQSILKVFAERLWAPSSEATDSRRARILLAWQGRARRLDFCESNYSAIIVAPKLRPVADLTWGNQDRIVVMCFTASTWTAGSISVVGSVRYDVPDTDTAADSIPTLDPSSAVGVSQLAGATKQTQSSPIGRPAPAILSLRRARRSKPAFLLSDAAAMARVA